MPIQKVCIKCRKLFKVRPSWEEAKYCSIKCFYDSRIGSKLSKEHKRKISSSLKAFYGRKYSEEETKIKINRGNHNKGKHLSEETKRRMSLSRLKWKRLPFSEETKRKMSEVRLLGIKEGRIKSSIGQKRPSIQGKNNYLYGKHLSEETKQKMKKARALQILPKKDTKPEIKIQNFLKELGIDFFTHQYIKEIEHGYQCDILIPSMNLVIECDGNYWHSYPIGRDIDHIRTKELIENGFKVLRLWEFEIKEMDLNKFQEKLIEVKQ